MVLSAAAPNPFLAEARVHFQAQDFQRCLKRLDQAASWKSTTTEEAEVSLYRGLCRFGVGEERAADGDFEHALRIDGEVALPAWTSPRIQAAFERARGQAGLSSGGRPVASKAPEAAAPVVRAVEAPAQRRMGPTAFIVSTAIGATALGVGVGLGVHARALETASFGVRFESEARAAALGARDFATAANATFAGAAAAAVAAGVLLLVYLVSMP